MTGNRGPLYGTSCSNAQYQYINTGVALSEGHLPITACCPQATNGIGEEQLQWKILAKPQKNLSQWQAEKASCIPSPIGSPATRPTHWCSNAEQHIIEQNNAIS